MSVQSNANRKEPYAANRPDNDGMNFLDAVSERHRMDAIHAIEKQKESLTLNPVHFSVVGDLDGSMPKCIVLLSEV
jgi:hypothetical protein